MIHQNAKHLMSFALCLAAVFLGSTVYYAVRADRYERYTDFAGQRAAAQLVGSLESMSAVMEALPYTADTNLFPQTAAQLSQHASAAAAALSALNLQEAHLLRTGQYINQAGDLAQTLLVQHLAGFPLEQTQLEQLRALCGGMEGLLEGVRDIKARLNAGDLSHGDFGAGDPALAAAMEELEKLAPEEGLRYDGRFGIRQEAAAAHLEGEAGITREQAAQKAAHIAGRQLPLLGELNAPIAAWRFGDGSTSITIAKQGGWVLGWLRDEPAGEAVLSGGDAEAQAEQFLQRLGYEGLTVSGRQAGEDWCMLTYTPVVDGVSWLPDAVTVTVSLVNGDVLALDAADYLLYHAARQQEGEIITPEQARNALPEGLEPDKGHMALAHSPGGRELLCYSFTCRTPEGDALRILVRADNGALWDLEPQPEQALD